MSGTSAVIPAAGRGERFGSGANKVFAVAAGKPILAHTLLAFEQCGLIDEIVLVVGPDEIEAGWSIAERWGITKLAAVVAGGGHRQDSVERGLAAVRASSHVVAIHDGARPAVRQETIRATIEAAEEHGAAVAAMPAIETIKVAGEANLVEETLDRRALWSIQTPQTFRKELLVRAIEEAKADGFYGTDDAALVERLGHPVKLVEGSYDNIKVTTARDLEVVECTMRSAAAAECPKPAEATPPASAVRVGFGYDVHRFAAGRKLFLGGVEFPDEEGLEGHSDADVILHAIADAVLGAAALGDIGKHFPNTDPEYHGISSFDLLSRTQEIAKKAGWTVVNVDATLVAERPRIAPRSDEMRERIALALAIDPMRVSVKATTAEKLGDIGAGLGAACYAVATLTA